MDSAIALTVAHEIGHTLGMWHYPDWEGNHHVMIVYLDAPYLNSSGFEDYGKFALKTLDGSFDVDDYWTDGMNTRHVLGRDCVQSILE